MSGVLNENEEVVRNFRVRHVVSFWLEGVKNYASISCQRYPPKRGADGDKYDVYTSRRRPASAGRGFAAARKKIGKGAILEFDLR